MALKPETQELYLWHCQAKSAGGEGRDPDFAFHEDVLINNDRFRPVDTPTTRARAVEIKRLHVLATQCRQRRVLAPPYREEAFLRLEEWAQSSRSSLKRGLSVDNWFRGENPSMLVSCLQSYQ